MFVLVNECLSHKIYMAHEDLLIKVLPFLVHDNLKHYHWSQSR